MSKDLHDAIMKIAQEEGTPEDEVRSYPDYSGRYMMGDETYGVVGHRTDVLILAGRAIERAKLEGEALTTDNLGHDTIVY